ncbi:MAG: propanediol utilization protein [Halanaerobium sp. 4-GBenrich]|jgi:propanediol utilization protein|uniref:phosphate propanoyltransferase n=1 Tax=Halanaerobium sp. TaxID=1895664 RepID=UPI0008689432|nr:phosphate propanoyltransferase [Halanaerobium sp.]ODS50070.1 MAG: propanediol utilization protein [Halanaerobium sp. 4-GBenrich]PUU95093.1 MAG: propanediol utilization protein [Halanaerobium sp.]
MEEHSLRKEIKNLILKMREDNQKNLIPIEASGRHIHLSQADVEKLFGEGYQLNPRRELSQPGQFLAEEKLRLIGPKSVVENVAVLGPARESTQVELSQTDAVGLGVKAPLRLSGNTEDTASLFIASAKNVVKLEEGAIIAKRHIHMTPEDAAKLDVEDGEIVNVEALTSRPVIFKDVLVRVNENYKLNMHLDYDEANACLLQKGDCGKVIKTGKHAND